MSVWPASLPPPEVSSFNNRDTLPVIKTAMSAGPPRRTRVSSHYMTTGQSTMTLNASQMTDFNQMIEDSGKTADWVTDAPIDTGGGLTGHRIRITSIQRKVVLPPDKLWKITIGFETDERL